MKAKPKILLLLIRNFLYLEFHQQEIKHIWGCGEGGSQFFLLLNIIFFCKLVPHAKVIGDFRILETKMKYYSIMIQRKIKMGHNILNIHQFCGNINSSFLKNSRSRKWTTSPILNSPGEIVITSPTIMFLVSSILLVTTKSREAPKTLITEQGGMATGTFCPFGIKLSNSRFVWLSYQTSQNKKKKSNKLH